VDDDYQINHTSMTYLVDPQGQVIDYFGFGTPSEQLAESVAGHIP
jgi:cytochrome oxidase Cu insertion factor (SCO1/SenC/PrrC family)